MTHILPIRTEIQLQAIQNEYNEHHQYDGPYILQTIWKQGNASEFQDRSSIVSLPHSEEIDKNDETSNGNHADCRMMRLTKKSVSCQIQITECYLPHCPNTW